MRNHWKVKINRRWAIVLLLIAVSAVMGIPRDVVRPGKALLSSLAWSSESSSFAVIQEAYSTIEKNHYAPVDSRRLMLGALAGMRDKVEADQGTEKVAFQENGRVAQWRIGAKSLSIPLDIDLDDESLWPLQDAYDLTLGAYYPTLKGGRELAYAAIEGMMKTLDPHSALMTPEAFRELQVETRGEFGGIGIEITLRDGKLTVVSPIEGTPAERLGVKAEDHIIKIDDFDTKGITLMGAVRRMRGPKGTTVTIHVRRTGSEKPLIFSIVRDIIQIRSVRSKVLPGKIGYIRLSGFVESTTRHLESALRKLDKEGVRGLVLDLRNNPGGLLRQAVQVSDLFLGKGSLIVYTRGKRPEHNLRFLDQRRGPFARVPMIVLVNSGSASASEIVTGALQDLHRALVMGTRSFGKGSVQTIIPLSDGSGLRITTALYYTPKGREIQEKGISPDLVVRQPGDDRDRDVVLERELIRSYRERNRSPHSEDNTPDKPGATESPGPEQGNKPPPKPILPGSEDDYQLNVARRVLAEEPPVRQVPQLLMRARQVVASYQPPSPNE